MTKAQKRKEIESSLLSQLQKKGADEAHFLDLVKDYMAMFEIKEKLEKDIKKRGISYTEPSASKGIEISKQNPSVKDLIMVNRQMLAILDRLQITTEKTIGGEYEEL